MLFICICVYFSKHTYKNILWQIHRLKKKTTLNIVVCCAEHDHNINGVETTKNLLLENVLLFSNKNKFHFANLCIFFLILMFYGLFF